MTPAVAARHLCKSYTCVDIDICQGKFVLLRDDRLQKSTLLHLLGSLHALSERSIKIFAPDIPHCGKDKATLFIAILWGLSSSATLCSPHTAAHENVEFPLSYRRVPRSLGGDSVP